MSAEEQWHLRPPNPNNPVVFFDVTVGGVPVKLSMDGALGNVGLTLGATGPAAGDEEGTLV